MPRLKAPFTPRPRGGGVITFIGTMAEQALYWFLEAIDPRSGMGPWPAAGSLKWQRTKTGKTKRSVNAYTGPPHTPVIRVGMHYKIGEVKVGQPSGLYDRLTVKIGPLEE